MSWMPPPLPHNNRESFVAYWQTIAEIPENEPGAAILRDMASERLAELCVAASHNRDAHAADQGPAYSRRRNNAEGIDLANRRSDERPGTNQTRRTD